MRPDAPILTVDRWTPAHPSHRNCTSAVIRKKVKTMAADQERADLADSLVTLGQGAMRAAMLINGASAAAALAFVGQVWSEKFVSSALTSAKCAILLFALGVATAAFSTLLAYFAQLFYYRATGEGFDEKVERTKAEVIRHVALGIVFLSFVISLLAFFSL